MAAPYQSVELIWDDDSHNDGWYLRIRDLDGQVSDSQYEQLDGLGHDATDTQLKDVVIELLDGRDNLNPGERAEAYFMIQISRWIDRSPK